GWGRSQVSAVPRVAKLAARSGGTVRPSASQPWYCTAARCLPYSAWLARFPCAHRQSPATAKGYIEARPRWKLTRVNVDRGQCVGTPSVSGSRRGTARLLRIAKYLQLQLARNAEKVRQHQMRNGTQNV